jgi:hypothetical protein
VTTGRQARGRLAAPARRCCGTALLGRAVRQAGPDQRDRLRDRLTDGRVQQHGKQHSDGVGFGESR